MAADVLTFANTPVKEMTVDGKWQALTPHTIDTSKGLAYNSQLSPDQIGVMVIEAALPTATLKIFAANPGPLTQDQLKILGEQENPRILKRCMERGTPALRKFNGRSVILSNFFTEERIRVSLPDCGGSMCTPAGKYEAHAFAVDKGKLVHIYLERSLRCEEMKGMTEQIAEKLQGMLTTAKWE